MKFIPGSSFHDKERHDENISRSRRIKSVVAIGALAAGASLLSIANNESGLGKGQAPAGTTTYENNGTQSPMKYFIPEDPNREFPDVDDKSRMTPPARSGNEQPDRNDSIKYFIPEDPNHEIPITTR